MNNQPFVEKGIIRISLARKVETNEWVVKVFVNNQYNDDASYYTDDKKDAIDTAEKMIEQYKSQGFQVYIGKPIQAKEESPLKESTMKQKLFESKGKNSFSLITESEDSKVKFIREGIRKVFAYAEGDVSYQRVECVGMGYIRDINEAKICALKEAKDVASLFGFTDNEGAKKFVKKV